LVTSVVDVARSRGALAVIVVVSAAIAVPVRAATPDEKLDALARFTAYRVYHAGPEFEGHQLSDVARGRDAKGKRTFSLIYGTCDAAPHDDTGCRPPYELQLYRACSRNAASYPREAAGRRTRGIRGAAVYEWSSRESFERLEVYTGKTTIVVWAPDRSSARRMVVRLRSGDGHIGVGDRLRRPARGALAGRLRC
jgi:hypothetical protein